MARPQSPDYDVRKQNILDKAAVVFAEHGFHKASVSQITQACAISKSLIYHYFPSKQDILYHTLKTHVGELDQLATSITTKGLPPEDTLRTIIHEYLHIYKDKVAQHQLLISELGALGSRERREIIALQNNVVGVFADLGEAISPASFKGRKAKKAIALLALGMMNWTYIWFKADGALTTDALADIISSMLIGGLKNLGSEPFGKAQ